MNRSRLLGVLQELLTVACTTFAAWLALPAGPGLGVLAIAALGAGISGIGALGVLREGADERAPHGAERTARGSQTLTSR